MMSEKSKMYANGEESNRAPRVLGPVQIYSDNPGKTMLCGALLVYTVHVVRLGFCEKLQQKHIYQLAYTFGFLPFEYERGGGMEAF